MQKLTIDLTDENREKLEKLKKDEGLPYGYLVNELIHKFANIPQNVKNTLINIIQKIIVRSYKELDGVSDFSFSKLNENINAYIGMMTYLNNGKYVSFEGKTTTEFQRLIIREGILICPKDYIIVNGEVASKSLYACVVECRNAEKFGMRHFGKPIPHFIYLCDKKYSSEYDEAFYERIKRLCIQAWPDFETVVKSQVDPVDDPEDLGQIINEREWLEAPNIGYFSVYEQGDRIYGPQYIPPAGVKIVRKETE